MRGAIARCLTVSRARSGAAAAILASLLLCTPASADPSPTQARGFSADKAFDIGEVDAVNPFNFNMVLTIPVGPEYPLSESLSYRFWVSHNANVWDYQQREETPPCLDDPSGCRTFTQAIPERYGNAGLGWIFSAFGRLFAPGAAGNDSNEWKYVSADGGEHLFFPTLHEGELQQANVFYSRDSSYLRLKVVSASVRTVEARDGTSYTFDGSGTLTQAKDRFDNALNVTVNATRWDLSDTHGRQHTVYLSADGRRVERAVLAAFGGATSTYTFGYSGDVEITRSCHHNDPALGTMVPVRLLTSITQPDTSSFAIPQSDYITGGCEQSGRIARLTLPTLGRIAWEYQGLLFPLESATESCNPEGLCEYLWRGSATGVRRRLHYDVDGTLLGTWLYESFLDSPLDPQQSKELRNRITTPLGHTDHFFSIYAGQVPDATWDLREFGLPFTRKLSDGSGRFLSTREYNSSAEPLRSNPIFWPSGGRRRCPPCPAVGSP